MRAEEEALRRAHDELQLRVQERTTELARANEALQVEIAERQAGGGGAVGERGDDDGQFTLMVSDNGVGFPNDLLSIDGIIRFAIGQHASRTA